MRCRRGYGDEVTPPHTAPDPTGSTGHPGSRLGLPATGPGSVAGWGRRLAALALDWLLANLAAVAITQSREVWSAQSSLGWVPLLVWFLEVWVLTALTGASAGQRILGITILRLDHRPVGLQRALVRTGLIMLVVPPLVFDRDGRGLHDLAAGTVAVRGPGAT